MCELPSTKSASGRDECVRAARKLSQFKKYISGRIFGSTCRAKVALDPVNSKDTFHKLDSICFCHSFPLAITQFGCITQSFPIHLVLI